MLNFAGYKSFKLKHIVESNHSLLEYTDYKFIISISHRDCNNSKNRSCAVRNVFLLYAHLKKIHVFHVDGIYTDHSRYFSSKKSGILYQVYCKLLCIIQYLMRFSWRAYNNIWLHMFLRGMHYLLKNMANETATFCRSISCFLNTQAIYITNASASLFTDWHINSWKYPFNTMMGYGFYCTCLSHLSLKFQMRWEHHHTYTISCRDLNGIKRIALLI